MKKILSAAAMAAVVCAPDGRLLAAPEARAIPDRLRLLLAAGRGVRAGIAAGVALPAAALLAQALGVVPAGELVRVAADATLERTAEHPQAVAAYEVAVGDQLAAVRLRPADARAARQRRAAFAAIVPLARGARAAVGSVVGPRVYRDVAAGTRRCDVTSGRPGCDADVRVA